MIIVPVWAVSPPSHRDETVLFQTQDKMEILEETWSVSKSERIFYFYLGELAEGEFIHIGDNRFIKKPDV